MPLFISIWPILDPYGNMAEIRKTFQIFFEELRTDTTSAFWDLLTFKGKSNLQKTLIMLLNWITVNISQYTLLLNTTKLHGNIFVNYIMSVLVGDLPGTFALLITMKYFGRRFNLFYAQTIIGVCCVLLAFLPKSVSSKTETLY